MKKKLLSLIIICSIASSALLTGGCSSNEVEVSSKGKRRCMTTRPSNFGFLKYIECGFDKRVR